MQSAGNIEKFGYCPLSWWLSRDSGISTEATEEGTLEHETISQRFHSYREKERSMFDWNMSLLISLTVLANLLAVFLIFLPSSTVSTKRVAIAVLSSAWMILALIFLLRTGSRLERLTESFYEVAIFVLSIVALILSFNTIVVIISDTVPEWTYGFICLVWGVISVLMIYFRRSADRECQNLKGRLNIEDKLEYIGDEDAPVLRSKASGVSGRPDLILVMDGNFVPVELKTGRTPPGPMFSHILQIGAYCILVSDSYGRRVDKGIIRYPEAEFEIEFDESLENLVLQKLEEMNEMERTGDVHRNHNRPGKCAKCSRASICPEALV